MVRFWQFFMVFVLRSVSQNAQFKLSNTTFGIIFKFFLIGGPLWSKFCKHCFYTYKLANESCFENRETNGLGIQPGMIQNL